MKTLALIIAAAIPSVVVPIALNGLLPEGVSSLFELSTAVILWNIGLTLSLYLLVRATGRLVNSAVFYDVAISLGDSLRLVDFVSGLTVGFGAGLFELGVWFTTGTSRDLYSAAVDWACIGFVAGTVSLIVGSMLRRKGFN